MKAGAFAFLVLAMALTFGCATSSYDSFRARTTPFAQGALPVAPHGMSAQEVEGILSTEFPPAAPVSVAILFLDPSAGGSRELAAGIISEGGNLPFLERMVPIPSVMIPAKLDFTAIQELGIRSLCEYTLLLYSVTNTLCDFSEFVKGEVRVVSDLEFMLVDNRTTAMIASDRLYTMQVYKTRTFTREEEGRARAAVFAEQSALLGRKLTALFTARR